jgi:3-deoxy-7-phosphoheptulonate synthase
VDPSHGTGDRQLVERLALAAVAAGADGLLVEVHETPDLARSDGMQQVTPETFERLAARARSLHAHLAGEPAASQRFSAT